MGSTAREVRLHMVKLFRNEDFIVAEGKDEEKKADQDISSPQQLKQDLENAV